MILCLDVGNTHIYGGVFSNEKIKVTFRYPSISPCTSDTFGLFLRQVLRENQCEPKEVSAIVISSVVPALDYSINSACIKYFNLNPLTLKPGIKTGLKIDLKNPLELGADRIANAVAATSLYPNQNLIVIDFGTASTVCALSKENVYLGGAILPGIKTSMESLSKNAAKLSIVDIVRPKHVLGKTTTTNVQSGIYFGHLGSIREIIQRMHSEVFADQASFIIATGGYSHLFEQEGLFDIIIPELVLQGLYRVWQKNS